MATRKTEKFANKASIELTMSGANTLTFEQIRFGVGLFQGVALVLHRLECNLTSTTMGDMVAAGDTVSVALVTTQQITQINDVTDPAVITRFNWYYPAVGVEHLEMPRIIDYSSFPGGGLLLAANPLFLAMSSSSLAAAGAVRLIMWFSWEKLTDRDYLELIEGRISSNI